MTASIDSDLIAASAGHEPGAAPRRRNLHGIDLILRRLVGAVGVVLAVLTVSFVVTRVLAPDPVNLFLGQSGNGFVNAEAEAVEKAKVAKALGLDTSLPNQYVHFLNDLVHGDLGQSFQTGRPVTTELSSRLPATLEMAFFALLIGVSIGILAGVVAAVRRDGLFDRATRFVAVGGMALPQFWIGLMLLWIFSTTLHWAPGPIGRLPAGMAPPSHITGSYVFDGLLTGQFSTARAAAAQLVLPVLTLAIGLAAPLFKVVRTSMLEAISADYVRTATALGFGSRRVYLSYALKNALLPVATVLAGIVAFTIAGSVLVEGVFGWPGVGNYALQAIQTSDFPAVQGFVLFSALLYVVIYELLEYTYTLIDPRVRS
jgi:ABC-type dipeptide/oligopeptide/nickel transport system permease component